VSCEGRNADISTSWGCDACLLIETLRGGRTHRRPIAVGESHRVDTGFIVGFDSTVDYKVEKSGGWKTTLLGGEGLVVNLTGLGRSTCKPEARRTSCNG